MLLFSVEPMHRLINSTWIAPSALLFRKHQRQGPTSNRFVVSSLPDRLPEADIAASVAAIHRHQVKVAVYQYNLVKS